MKISIFTLCYTILLCNVLFAQETVQENDSLEYEPFDIGFYTRGSYIHNTNNGVPEAWIYHIGLSVSYGNRALFETAFLHNSHGYSGFESGLHYAAWFVEMGKGYKMAGVPATKMSFMMRDDHTTSSFAFGGSIRYQKTYAKRLQLFLEVPIFVKKVSDRNNVIFEYGVSVRLAYLLVKQRAR